MCYRHIRNGYHSKAAQLLHYATCANPRILLDLTSASDSLTASSLQTLLQRFCNTLSPTCIAMHHMPNSCTKHPVPHCCYTDPGDLPSFADQCSVGNCSLDSYPGEKTSKSFLIEELSCCTQSVEKPDLCYLIICFSWRQAGHQHQAKRGCCMRPWLHDILFA